MRIADGKTTREITREELKSTIRQYPRVLVDIGTGDGKFVYRTAQDNPDWFCIGVDADLSSLSEYSRKSQRKPERGGLPNVMYVVSGVEDLPPELDGIADRVTVHLPWGSLLVGIVQADADVLSGLARVGKPGAELELLIGYSRKYEEYEMRRRGLPDLSLAFVDESMAQGFANAGLRIVERRILTNEELKAIPLTWGRRLAHGRERETFLVRATVERAAVRAKSAVADIRSEACGFIRFTARGHSNVKATHATTFEFAKEPEIGPTADCIIGISADWKPEDIERLKEFHKARMTISCGGIAETVKFVVNPGFRDEREMVIRKSNFRSSRTLGVNADKSARQLSRELAKALAESGSEIVITIEALPVPKSRAGAR